ncbi:MAG: hypothetical protein JAY75_20480 [Candidatus Thiodiazotropha taylori]|nr:hypothetical protein [Candidatus Thiodiazotropha taylori]MCG8097005.1 hypothetical protein [Candidatus Thiodiazotropha endolucinida]MCG7884294.1 hypothetical protein [Candidatus Thiodiazotropha taylori]MCG7887245.1 hypothetical protein [Candidatus Thiodiazotropha taylori]MCG7891944.1 hypothetical protein [Candidatus Thiodiazotropha taylori]
MKLQNIVVITVLSLLAVSCSDIDSKIPCTTDIDWIPREKEVVEDSYSISQQLTLANNSVFEAVIDFTFLGKYNSPFITISLTNRQSNKLIIDVIKLRVTIDDENLPISRIDVTDFASCDGLKCASTWEGNEINNLAITPGGFIKLNYYFDYRISNRPEEANAEVKIETTKGIDQEIDVDRMIPLDKYMKRYNCIWGEGHPYQRIE